MKVAAKAMRSLSVCVSVNSAGLSTRSTLLSTSTLAERTSPSVRRIASSSSCRPLWASINSATISASCVEPQAVADHGAVEPPPRRKNSRRIDEDELRHALDGDAAHERAGGLHFGRDDRDFGCRPAHWPSVDLPTLGAPISATKPQRVVGSAGRREPQPLRRSGLTPRGSAWRRRRPARRRAWSGRSLRRARNWAAARRRGIPDL